jgi:Domain of unknown function DUF29
MTNRVALSVTERVSFADGHEFGAAGSYERPVGRAHFARDPHAPAHHGITDIDKAPTDIDGLVRYTGDFAACKQYSAEVVRSLHAKARAALDDKLSPTLRRDIGVSPEKMYADGHRHADLSLRGEEDAGTAFPAKCPYSLDETLQQDWYPVSSGR